MKQTHFDNPHLHLETYKDKTCFLSNLMIVRRFKQKIKTIYDKNNIVYEIDCSNRQAVYFGETV